MVIFHSKLLVYQEANYSFHGVYIPSYITGGHHFLQIPIIYNIPHDFII